MTDLDDIQMAALARELVMNIRNYKETFALFGIDEKDYQLIEKNEFFRKVREQFTLEWNASTSTDERIRLQHLAYLEKLSPVLARRAMQPDANLSASTDVAKIFMKGSGMGEPKSEKASAERFIITINMGGETETYDKSIEINPNDTASTEIGNDARREPRAREVQSIGGQPGRPDQAEDR
jgi:hypothetical protein